MTIPKPSPGSRSRFHVATFAALVLTIGFAAVASALTIGNIDGV